ncbi:MAG: DinB family protein [Massilia sp.]
MPTREDIVLLASYNTAMNAKLYDAAASLPKEAVSADRGAFFGSIQGSMNHIAAGDTIWLRRFLAHPAKLTSLGAMADIPAPTGLAYRFSEDLDVLLQHRIRLDAIIEAMAAEICDADLAQAVPYTNSRGDFRKNFGGLLLHMFNHQTHHRGQASTLLSQSGVDIGVTDLVAWMPDCA